ncbi:MAG: TonB-dependent receptor [Agarilytica sp.]
MALTPWFCGLICLIFCSYVYSDAVPQKNHQNDISLLSRKIVLFDIAPQSLKSGLVEFGLQADVNIIVPAPLVSKMRSNDLSGRYRIKRGLELLLAGTGLLVNIEDASNTVILSEGNGGRFSSIVDEEYVDSEVREVEDVIIVSARHKKESIIDVPISLMLRTEEELDRGGIRDITQLGSSVVNVSLSVVRATNSTLATYIRGVGQGDPLVGFESGVGIYIDDVYLSRPQGAVLDIYDVERVEILRGPQGTLYGRNTVGGAVKYVTKALPDEAFFKAKAFAGSYNQKDFILSGAIPLLENSLRFGVSAGSLKRDGYGRNFTTGKDNYDKDIAVGRLVTEYQPREDFFLRVVGSRTVDNSNPRTGYRYRLREGEEPLNNVYNTYAGNSQGLHPIDDSYLVGSGVSSFLEWDISDHYSLESITAYRQGDSQSPIDFDGSAEAVLNSEVLYKNKQATQEFRLKFEYDNFWGLAGLYYLESTALNAFDLETDGATETIEPGIGSFTFVDLDVESEAAFFSVNFGLFSSLKFSAGARYTFDYRKVEIVHDQFEYPQTDVFISPYFGGDGESIVDLVFDDNGKEVTPRFNGSRNDKQYSPRVSISWQPTDLFHLYAQYSTGFKAGSFDPRGDFSLEESRKGFSPEIIKTNEVGLKSILLEDHLHVNMAIFYSKYLDMQVPGTIFLDRNGDGESDTFVGLLTNAGRATIKGMELESSAKLNDSVYVDFSYGYISAKFNTYMFAGFNIADYRVFPNTPETTTSFGLRIQEELWSGDISAGFMLNYQSSVHFFITENGALDQSGYTLVDASMVWDSYDERWQIGLYGKNLSDKRYRTGGYDFDPLAGTAFYGDPRTFSFSVSRRFE